MLPQSNSNSYGSNTFYSESPRYPHITAALVRKTSHLGYAKRLLWSQVCRATLTGTYLAGSDPEQIISATTKPHSAFYAKCRLQCRQKPVHELQRARISSAVRSQMIPSPTTSTQLSPSCCARTLARCSSAEAQRNKAIHMEQRPDIYSPSRITSALTSLELEGHNNQNCQHFPHTCQRLQKGQRNSANAPRIQEISVQRGRIAI